MKILVLGGNGMAGHMISIYLLEQGHEVVVFARRKRGFCETVEGNAKDFCFLEKVIKEGRYDAIVNAIGILNEEAEGNKADAVLINSYLPHFLSDMGSVCKSKVIQISTDCVFSGKRGGYLEKSFRDGETFYDRSKALGELENDRDLTFRTSIIGPAWIGKE